MSPPTEQQQAFIRFMGKLIDDEERAPLAALRRGLGKEPGEAAEMHRYVIPWLSDDAKPWQEEAYYLVASLFAWHQVSWQQEGTERQVRNLGASFEKLKSREREHLGTEPASVERRFVALLNCHYDDLPYHLRSTVGLLRSKDIGVDWAQLLHDILGWRRDDRAVQREWARAYWGRTQAQPTTDGQSPIRDESTYDTSGSMDS